MRYQNVNNGVIINVPSKIGGNDWIPVDEVPTNATTNKPAKPVSAPVEESTPVKPKLTSQEGGDDFEGITVKQIKQELDANGIKYSKTAKKQELYDLMMGM